MKSFLTNILIPILLIVLGLGIAMLQMPISLSVLNYSHINSITKSDNRMLVAGNVVHGKFIADENYLGTVWVNINTAKTRSKSDKSIVVFRIREEGSENWYSSTQYTSEVFYSLHPFPFGIPIIPNSKNNVYEFELFSLDGTENNAVVISDHQPDVIASYQYPKQLLLHNPMIMKSFFVQKVMQSLLLPTTVSAFVIYSILPLTIYVLWRMRDEKQRKSDSSKNAWIKVIIFFILLVILISSIPLFNIGFVVLLLAIEVFLFRLDDTRILYLIILLLSAMIISLSVGQNIFADDYGQFAFFLLILWYLQVIRSNKPLYE